MARTVKSADERQNEILDTAQVFFYTKGYEKTAVRDIIEEVGIAKGTFYHHFNSKEDLLNALILRMIDQSLAILEPIAADGQLTALEKLHMFFGEVGNFKLANEAFLRTLLPIWYDDSNTLMREKMLRITLEKFATLYTQIIWQGIDEGVFSVMYPDEMGYILLQTMYSMSDRLVRLLLDTEKKTDWETFLRKTDACNAALDSLLNAEPGSIQIFVFEPFRHWFEE